MRNPPRLFSFNIFQHSQWLNLKRNRDPNVLVRQCKSLFVSGDLDSIPVYNFSLTDSRYANISGRSKLVQTNSPPINLESLRRRAVHPFPARMAASIPWDTLRLRKRRLRVLDPMAGSGTAAIVARATGHTAFAYDLDPLAVLITRVGTCPPQKCYPRRLKGMS